MEYLVTYKRLLFVCFLLGSTLIAKPTPSNEREPLQTNWTKGALPASGGGFTKNVGQWPDSILYRASSQTFTIWFTENCIYYLFLKRTNWNNGASSISRLGVKGNDRDSVEWDLVKVQFSGASTGVETREFDRLPFRSNYFHGSNATNWRTDVPSFTSIELLGIYPGVDAIFTEDRGLLLYELRGSAHALAQVKIDYPSSSTVSIDDATIAIETLAGTKKFRGLFPWMGTTQREASYPPEIDVTSATLGVEYSKYLGGTGEDKGEGIAVDANGSAYVTGTTYSSNFPLMNYADGISQGREVFLTKYSSNGTMLFSTYLGGNDTDESFGGIAIDGSGSVYITAATSSTDYPTVSGAFQTNTGGGAYDAVVTKLPNTGNYMIYSTYLGGSNEDIGLDLAVNGTGQAFVTGRTKSSDFPILNAFQPTLGGVGLFDAFLTKLAANGSSIEFSSFLGGTGDEYGLGIALGANGTPYVAGLTISNNFPTKSAFQPSYVGADGFVTRFGINGDSLIYSTYLHGSTGAWDDVQAIAVDSTGAAYVTGRTANADFPTQSPFQGSYGGGSYDAFVSKLSPTGTSLIYSTFLGGDSIDFGYDIAVDKFGSAFVTGYTTSSNFPVFSQYQSDSATTDVFVTRLSKSGSSVVYSTYLRGNGADEARGIAVMDTGHAFVTGVTTSSEFPSGTGTTGSPNSVFVTKLSRLCCAGTTGDINMDGHVDISDQSILISFLTVSPKPRLGCPEEANVNGSNGIDISDLAMLISYLTTVPRPTLPACP